MVRTPGSGSSCRYIVLGCLSDTEWLTTKEVAEMAGVRKPCAYQMLMRLERDGQVVRRAAGNAVQWCWYAIGDEAIPIEEATATVPF